MPSDSDKGVFFALLPVLENLDSASVCVQADQHVSISIVASLIHQMRADWLQPKQNVDSNIIRDFKLAVLEKLDHFFPQFGSASILLKASALDPRFQLAFLSVREQSATWTSLAEEISLKNPSSGVPAPIPRQEDQIVEVVYEDEVLEEGSVVAGAVFLFQLEHINLQGDVVKKSESIIQHYLARQQ